MEITVENPVDKSTSSAMNSNKPAQENGFYLEQKMLDLLRRKKIFAPEIIIAMEDAMVKVKNKMKE